MHSGNTTTEYRNPTSKRDASDPRNDRLLNHHPLRIPESPVSLCRRQKRCNFHHVSFGITRQFSRRNCRAIFPASASRSSSPIRTNSS